MTKPRLLIIASIVLITIILLSVLAPQRFATRYEANVRLQINSYLEDKKARQPEMEAIIQKGATTSKEEDQKLHDLIGAEIKAAENLISTNDNMPLQSLLSWHPAYKKPLHIQQELQSLALEAKRLYQTSDTINTYLEKRIGINVRISNNPLETAEHRQQMIDDYKSMVATNNENNLLQHPAIKEGIAAKLAVDTRYLELWAKYPTMYEQGDNKAIDELSVQILANDHEKSKANELVNQMVTKVNQDIKVNHESINRLRDFI